MKIHDTIMNIFIYLLYTSVCLYTKALNASPTHSLGYLT